MDSDWMGLAGILLMSYNDSVRKIREQEKKLEQLEEENNRLKESQEREEIEKRELKQKMLNLEKLNRKHSLIENKILETVSAFKTKKPDLTKFNNLLKKYRAYRYCSLAKIKKLTPVVEDYKKFLAENELTFDNRPFDIEEIKQQIVNNEILQKSIEADIENLKNTRKQKSALFSKALKKYNRAENSIFRNLNVNRVYNLKYKYEASSRDCKEIDSELSFKKIKKTQAIDEKKYLEDKLQKINLMINAGTYNQLLDVVGEYKKIESLMKDLVLEQQEKDKQSSHNWRTFLENNKNSQIFKDACDLHNYFKENNITDRTSDDITFDINKYVNFGKFAECCSEFIFFDNNYKYIEKQLNNVEEATK